MTTPDLQKLNQQLIGRTNVQELTFTGNLATGVCDLRIILFGGTGSSLVPITLSCEGVSHLDLRNFGGGITQLLYLQVQELSPYQWDRLHYKVSELERDDFKCFCRHVFVEFVEAAAEAT